MNNTPTITPIIKVIIGLGNPGTKYRYNRHNIGFLVLNELESLYQSGWGYNNNYEISTLHTDTELLALVKPQTFMNSSGDILPHFLRKGISIENVLVIHDELEHTFGKVTLKQGGSARGHNGLRSIIERGGMNFWRLRCGIGRPENKEQVPHYVLSNFSEPQEAVETMITNAVKIVTKLLNLTPVRN